MKINVDKVLEEFNKPKSLADAAGDTAKDIVKEIIDVIAEAARDELEFRSTGHRPAHDILHSEPTGPPPKAFANAKSAAELGIEDETLYPFVENEPFTQS